MKVNYLKYSDERNKYFSIKTEICLENENKFVCKRPIFPEGKHHIEQIFDFQKLLKKYYDNVEICRAWKQENCIKFEFVEGEMLLEKYKFAIKTSDIVLYEKILKYHKKLICGNSDNECIFEDSVQFAERFGNSETYKGVPGLKCSNFDAIATNIIIQDAKSVFIDYEWVMDFIMPKDLVIYHCIKDAYLHSQSFEKFYPFKKVMKLLDIKIEESELQKNYEYFFNYVISDKDGRSYAKDKYQCLKSIQHIDAINEEWQKCADNWKEAVQANENLTKELKNANEEWQKCADNWKEAVQANENLTKELKNANEEWQICADNWKKAVQANENLTKELKNANEEWQICAGNWKKAVETNVSLTKELDTIKNTKMWKIQNKVKNMIKKIGSKFGITKEKEGECI